MSSLTLRAARVDVTPDWVDDTFTRRAHRQLRDLAAGREQISCRLDGGGAATLIEAWDGPIVAFGRGTGRRQAQPLLGTLRRGGEMLDGFAVLTRTATGPDDAPGWDPEPACVRFGELDEAVAELRVRCVRLAYAPDAEILTGGLAGVEPDLRELCRMLHVQHAFSRGDQSPAW